jgi:CRISP-associated protein Cas1
MLNQNQNKQIVTLIASQEQKEKISIQNQNLLFTQNGIAKIKIPISKIQLIIIVGDMTITTPFLAELSKNQVRLSFCKYNFDLMCELISPEYSSFNLKNSQFELICNPITKLHVAKHLVKNKIINQFGSEPVDLVSKLELANSTSQLMGVEGSYSTIYFQQTFKTINWKSRQPRLKTDIPNFLLDIGYTYLFNYVASLCSQLGFENTFGFLHTDYYQRQSLICDIMEPMRPIVDRALVKAWNLKQIQLDDFENVEGRIKLVDYRQSAKYTAIFIKAILSQEDSIWKYLNSFAQSIQSKDIANLPDFVC